MMLHVVLGEACRRLDQPCELCLHPLLKLFGGDNLVTLETWHRRRIAPVILRQHSERTRFLVVGRPARMSEPRKRLAAAREHPVQGSAVETTGRELERHRIGADGSRRNGILERYITYRCSGITVHVTEIHDMDSRTFEEFRVGREFSQLFSAVVVSIQLAQGHGKLPVLLDRRPDDLRVATRERRSLGVGVAGSRLRGHGTRHKQHGDTKNCKQLFHVPSLGCGCCVGKVTASPRKDLQL